MPLLFLIPQFQPCVCWNHFPLKLFAFEPLRLQTSGILLLLPFILLDKGFFIHRHPCTCSLRPVGDCRIRDTGLHPHLSVSKLVRAATPPASHTSAPSRGSLTSGRPLCPFSELSARISLSFFLFFNPGLFSHYKSISSSQGGEELKSLPSPTLSLWALTLYLGVQIGPLLHGGGGGARGNQDKEGIVQSYPHVLAEVLILLSLSVSCSQEIR